VKLLLVFQHPVDDPEEFTGGGHDGDLFASPMGNLVIELGEVGIIFDMYMDALGENPPDPFVPGFGNVAMMDHLAALPGGGGKTGIGTEFMGAAEPGDIPDFCNKEECRVGADPGDGHEDLGISVPLGTGGDLGGDIFYLFLQVFKEGKISVYVGDGEGVEPVFSLLGEDIFVGLLDPVFMEFGMDLVFQFRAELHQVGSLPDNIPKLPDVWWGKITGGQEITPE